jgi:dynein heavy chain, axonemal
MLKEPYMRTRHWDKMQKALGQVLEYENEAFNIGEYFKLNLLSQADSVREVCEVAREEFKIESALA